MKIRIIQLTILTIIYVFLQSCNRPVEVNQYQTSTFSKIKKDGKITVGYIVYDPFVIRNPINKELSGTFIDIMKEIASQMEVEVEFVESTFATFVAGLQSKKFDLSIAPTFTTIARAKSVAFSTPLVAGGNSAIVRKGDQRFKNLSDIDKKGIVVAVTQGEQGQEYAKRNLTNAEIIVISGGDQNLTLSEVLTGRADVALGDFYICKKFAEEHDGAFDLFATNPYNVTPVAWSVRYTDLELLHFINTCIENLELSGYMDKVNKKYNANFLHPKNVWVR